MKPFDLNLNVQNIIHDIADLTISINISPSAYSFDVHKILRLMKLFEIAILKKFIPVVPIDQFSQAEIIQIENNNETYNIDNNIVSANKYVPPESKQIGSI
jgi:hypothetical protein